MLATKTVAKWVELVQHAPDTEAGYEFAATIEDACDGRDLTETLTIDVDPGTLTEAAQAAGVD